MTNATNYTRYVYFKIKRTYEKLLFVTYVPTNNCLLLYSFGRYICKHWFLIICTDISKTIVQNYAGLFPKIPKYMNEFYYQTFSKAFVAFVYSPSIFLAGLNSKIVFNKSNCLCPELYSRMRIFHPAFVTVAKIIIDHSILIPVPLTLKLKMPELFDFMTTDYHHFRETDDRKKMETHDTHIYDLKRVESKEHFSSNIPQFLYIVGFIVMFHNLWIEEQGQLDLPYAIDDDNYIMCSNWNNKKDLSHVRAANPTQKKNAFVKSYAGWEVEEKFRKAHFQKGDLKDFTNTDYMSSYMPSIGFVKANEFRKYFIGKKASVPVPSKEYTYYELVKIIFDDSKPKTGHPFFFMDRNIPIIIKHFSMEQYRQWTSKPLHNIGSLVAKKGNKDAKLETLGLKVKTTKEKHKDKVEFEQPFVFGTSDKCYLEHQTELYKRKNMSAPEFVAAKDLLTQKMEGVLRLIHVMVSSEVDSSKPFTKDELNLINKKNTVAIYNQAAPRMADFLYESFRGLLMKGAEDVAKQFDEKVKSNDTDYSPDENESSLTNELWNSAFAANNINYPEFEAYPVMKQRKKMIKSKNHWLQPLILEDSNVVKAEKMNTSGGVKLVHEDRVKIGKTKKKNVNKETILTDNTPGDNVARKRKAEELSEEDKKVRGEKMKKKSNAKAEDERKLPASEKVCGVSKGKNATNLNEFSQPISLFEDDPQESDEMDSDSTESIDDNASEDSQSTPTKDNQGGIQLSEEEKQRILANLNMTPPSQKEGV